MPRVELSGPHFEIAETSDGLSIVVPVRRNWFTFVFGGFWHVLWLSFGRNVLFGSASRGLEGGTGPFMLALTLFWALGACWLVYNLLWAIAGRHIVEVSDRTLSTQQRIGPFRAGRRYEYAAEHISDLRSAAGAGGQWGAFELSMRRGGIGVGGVAFDYGSRSPRFGDGLDEAEAKQLIAIIKKRLPDLG